MQSVREHLGASFCRSISVSGDGSPAIPPRRPSLDRGQSSPAKLAYSSWAQPDPCLDESQSSSPSLVLVASTETFPDFTRSDEAQSDGVITGMESYGAPASSSLERNVSGGSNGALSRTQEKWPVEPWVRGESIGRGTLGEVFTAMSQEDGRIFCVKEVKFSSDTDRAKRGELDEALDEEMKMLKELKHENIVSYLGHGRFDGCHYIYLEYMPGGSLLQVLKQYGHLDESLLRVYMRQILHGLHYLHTRSPAIIHRDIKGANILVGLDCKVKLADFGCCARCKLQPTDQSVSLDGSKVSATMTGSIPWMAPEVMNQQVYGRKADIWSLGCLLLEMATGKQPWGLNFDNPMAAMCKIAMSNETPPIPDFLSEDCQDFARKCLQRDPKVRPHCSELLEHPF